MAVFNSSEYSWADLSIALGGRILDGVTGLEYTEKQDKDRLYGRGNKPHKIIRGNKEFEGKITIWQSELEAMVRDAPDNDLLKLNFEVIATYKPHDGGQTVTDILVGCEWTEIKKAFSQGDKNMLVELPFVFLNVKPQQ
ncbi:MAG: hypothetical protein WA775_03035 [Psychroserpens sp.]|uniref:hypothetical protein n=1 Tax=Psychroserpens sp. TaxID=2020870 RepID=UPI003CB3838C